MSTGAISVRVIKVILNGVSPVLDNQILSNIYSCISNSDRTPGQYSFSADFIEFPVNSHIAVTDLIRTRLDIFDEVTIAESWSVVYFDANNWMLITPRVNRDKMVVSKVSPTSDM